MRSIFDIAISKGRSARAVGNWDLPLHAGESYSYIADNDIAKVSRHVERLERIIDELLDQIEARNA